MIVYDLEETFYLGESVILLAEERVLVLPEQEVLFSYLVDESLLSVDGGLVLLPHLLDLGVQLSDVLHLLVI